MKVLLLEKKRDRENGKVIGLGQKQIRSDIWNLELNLRLVFHIVQIFLMISYHHIQK